MKHLYSNLLQKISLTVFFISVSLASYARIFYVSSLSGDDNRSVNEAQSIATPWKSIARVNAAMSSLQAGDQILFKKGETFAGALIVTVSGAAGNPLLFGAYGDGNLPEITGFVTLSGWQQKGGNIWETTVPGGLSYQNTVIVNGAMQACGRYPNASAANQGYLTYESYNGNTSITDSKLASQPNWAGGQVVVRKTRWVVDRNEITSQNGTTINYTSASGYGGAAGYGYFIQNHPSALDLDGEWYYRSSGQKLGIYSSTAPDSKTIRAGVIETLVKIANQSNITFQNLRFSGATAAAFDLSSAQNIKISSCEVLFSGKNAINANNSDNLTVESSTLAHTNNNAFNINNCNSLILNNNQIKSTAVFAGMGEGGDGTYEGIQTSGSNSLIQNNLIDSVGYIALNFGGNNITIKNNTVSNFTLTKDDGGGIYTWNNGSNAPTNSGRIVTGNIVLNGIGAPGGTDNVNKRFSHGIYIDDNAGGVELSNNTVANCASYGVYIHNAHDIVIKNNNLYNNAVQLEMEHDNVAADKPIYNCSVTGNTLFAKQASQLAAEYKTKDNDITNFGTFNNNYYYRPLDNDLVIGVLQQVNSVYSYQFLSLESWKALYGKDVSSVKPLHNVAPYTVTKISGANQFTNGNFDANVGGLYAYSGSNNCSTSWESGKLDGGSLKVSFSSTTNSGNYGSVIIGIGSITVGKIYRLKFSMIGGNAYKAVSAYLRQSGGGYADLSDRKAVTITDTRVDKVLFFTATATESNASIVFDVPEQSQAVYLDNIAVEAVDATATNPDDYFNFLYNTTAASATYSTGGQSYDAANNSYTSSVKVDGFSSIVLVHDTATTTAAAPVTVNCSATGTILREEWDNVGGTSIANIPLTTTPSSTSQLTSFEGPLNTADNYGSRIRGYVCAPQTGSYTFWLATDDAGELWLSTDSVPANKTRIAYVDGWTNYREWGKYSSQKSVLITLQAGKKYYIEALQKEGGGGDNLSVQWQLPDATMETPIAGSHLSPYVDTTKTVAVAGTGTITRDEWDNVGGNTISDIPQTTKPTKTATVTSFEGPLNAADNYASRIRGFVYPPKTGSYTFWLATDDAGELWLSSDDSPANKVKIANVDSWTDYRQFDKFSSQKSAAVNLVAGKKYYIEALQKEGAGGDNLSVKWQLPDGTSETPIAGSHLAPYTVVAADQTIIFNTLAAKVSTDTPFNVTATASSGLAVSFSIVSGPATISGNTITLNGTAGTVTVQASQAGNDSFNAAPNVTQSFTVTASNVCSATGTILREEWDNVSGNNVYDFGYSSTPSSTSMLTAFEGPSNISSNYASRVRGYICAPQTGTYTFWIAADDAAELYVSSNDQAASKVKIAYLLSWANAREWYKYSTQKSGSVYMEAGKKYYIEAIHKQGGGGDNLSVQWQLPNGTIESPLPGKYLSPASSSGSSNLNAYVKPLAVAAAGTLSADENVQIGLFVYPNPVSQQAKVAFTLAENGQTTVSLYNMKGQLVNKLFTGFTQANVTTELSVSADALQNGQYILHLSNGKTSLSTKMIVVK